MHWLPSILILAHEEHEGAAGADFIHEHDATGLPLIVLAAGVLLALIVFVFLFIKLGKRKKPAESDEDALKINVGTLSTDAPPTDGAQLEIYNVPMRLVLLVIAPVGREGKIPSNEQLPTVVDAIIPNLMEVMKTHRPEFRRWPWQISSQGFSQAFFTNVPLPGDHGKNTPWSSLAGRFDTPNGPFLAGLVCVSATTNAIGQTAINRSGQWLDVARVKL